MTFNEPRVIADVGFNSGIMPPSRCSKEYGNCTNGNSGTEPYIVAHNIILSHANVVDTYRRKFQVIKDVFFFNYLLSKFCFYVLILFIF